MKGRAVSDLVCNHCAWQKAPRRTKGPPGVSPKYMCLAASPGYFSGWEITKPALPEKELVSLSLPPSTPTHGDGLFVVTSAASGGPWEG